MDSPQSNIEFEDFDFTVIVEPWNEYQLGDETVIRHKYVLTRVLMRRTSDQTFDLRLANRIISEAVKLREDMYDEPTEQPWPNLNESIVHADIECKPIGGIKRNEYMLSNGMTLIIMDSVVTVHRTNVHKPDGEPLYLVISTQQIVVPKPPRD